MTVETVIAWEDVPLFGEYIKKLEEFDKTLNIEDIMSSLKEHGHNELLLNDIENGFKDSTIYSEL